MMRVVSCLLCVGICLVSGKPPPRSYEEFASGPCHLMLEFTANLPEAHTPSCTPDGYFAPVQCNDIPAFCWCSEPDGTEIPESMVMGQMPDCEGAVATTPVPFTEKCERLMSAVHDAWDFVTAIFYHIVVDTTILDSRVNVNGSLLESMRTMPPELIPSLFVDVGVLNENKLRNIVCLIANAKSLSDLVTQFQMPPEPIHLIPPPAERKKYLGYLLLQSRVLKETIDDYFDALAFSRYPKFPLFLLQEDKDAVIEALGAYLVAAKELIFQAMPDYSVEERQGTWSMISELELTVWKKLLEAKRYEEVMSEEFLDTMDPDSFAIALDITFDAVQNRDLYFGIFDVLESLVFAVTDIGLLDLPVGIVGNFLGK